MLSFKGETADNIIINPFRKIAAGNVIKKINLGLFFVISLGVCV